MMPYGSNERKCITWYVRRCNDLREIVVIVNTGNGSRSVLTGDPLNEWDVRGGAEDTMPLDDGHAVRVH